MGRRDGALSRLLAPVIALTPSLKMISYSICRCCVLRVSGGMGPRSIHVFSVSREACLKNPTESNAGAPGHCVQLSVRSFLLTVKYDGKTDYMGND